jgi:hypothetical protein
LTEKLRILAYAGNWLGFQCKFAANKITGAAATQSYYQVEKQGVEERASSADALDHARAHILTAIDPRADSVP